MTRSRLVASAQRLGIDTRWIRESRRLLADHIERLLRQSETYGSACGRCDSRINDEVEFCPWCGAEFGPALAPAEKATEATEKDLTA